MKQLFAVLLCLLLCGCAQEAPPAREDTVPETTAIAVMAGLYDPEHPMEQTYPGLVRAYPLTVRKTHGVLALGKEVLTLSGQGSTTLTLFTGEDLHQSASLPLDFLLQQEDPSLQIHENGISYFDPHREETVLLDGSLKEIRRITAPENLSGKPILSPDANTLYYCTGWAVMAWDLESGIRRTVKELIYEHQELTGLHGDGGILECTIRKNGTATKLLLTVDLGQEIRRLPENTLLVTKDNRYFSAFTSGFQTLLVFGETDGSTRLLLPEGNWQQQFYLPEDHAAVTVCDSESGTELHYFELNTGILRSSLTLPEFQTPKNIVNTKGHGVYILVYDPAADCDVLYRWDVLGQAPDPNNITTYLADYRTPEDPDLDALADCREYADAIGEEYGIRVLVWEDAAALQPWDYRFEPEHLAPILQKELKLLEQRLEEYPEGFLEQTKNHFTGLTICLVRQISGTTEEGSLSSATGIQFFEDNHAYVVITTGKHSQQALYHELYHVMETHLLTESTALDPWEELNPAGFVYGSSQQEDIYLQGQTRAFVDRYSMSALKEDRARVMENAMLPGKEEVFRSEYMQRKLNALCSAIREAYGLKKHPEALPWEQYLVNPLMST